MFWRYLSDGKAVRPEAARYADVIERNYRQMDELVGRILREISSDTILFVISDHGFASFARGVNLNSWLWQEGYLALKTAGPPSGDWFKGVDWERTRAYALGLNGLYINQKGRERTGMVSEGGETEALKAELRQKLTGLRDPETQQVAIREVFDRRAVFRGPYSENAPDLIIGYDRGYRVSWDSVTGKVTRAVFEDNLKAWSGDHCIDPRLVPGVLFSNHRIAAEAPAIVDIAPTVLDLFGVKLPSYLDGKPWQVSLDR
jgi:predicted AlkP superfamily phosphohydrolase/phosphomutase